MSSSQACTKMPRIRDIQSVINIQRSKPMGFKHEACCVTGSVVARRRPQKSVRFLSHNGLCSGASVRVKEFTHMFMIVKGLRLPSHGLATMISESESLWLHARGKVWCWIDPKKRSFWLIVSMKTLSSLPCRGSYESFANTAWLALEILKAWAGNTTEWLYEVTICDSSKSIQIYWIWMNLVWLGACKSW